MWLLVYGGNVVCNVVTGTKIDTRSITSLLEIVRQHEGVGRDRGKKVSTRRGMWLHHNAEGEMSPSGVFRSFALIALASERASSPYSEWESSLS